MIKWILQQGILEKKTEERSTTQPAALKSPPTTIPRTKKRSGGKSKTKVKSKKPTNLITSFLRGEKSAYYSDGEETDFKSLRNRSLSGNIYTSSLVIETNAIVSSTGITPTDDNIALNTSLNSVHDLSAIAPSEPANHNDINKHSHKSVTSKPSSKDALKEAKHPIHTSEDKSELIDQRSAMLESGEPGDTQVKMPTTNPQTTSSVASVTQTVCTTTIASSSPHTGHIMSLSATQPSAPLLATNRMGTTMMQDYWRQQIMPPTPLASNPIQLQLNNISTTVTQLAKDVKDYAASTKVLDDKIESIQFEQEIETGKVRIQDKRVRNLENKVELLAKLVCAQDTEILALKTKLMYEEKKEMKNTLIIHGIVKNSDKSCVELVQEFFENDMKMNTTPRIINAYRKGNPESDKDKDLPMVVKLQGSSDREAVFQCTKNLKDHKNSKDRFFSVRVMMPEMLNEEDQRKRQIVSNNKKLPVPQRQVITLKKGELLIGKKPYSKQVQKMDASDILSISPDELVKIKDMKVAVGTKRIEENSTFLSYAAEVNDIQQIRNLYQHVKVKHADASHVILGYRLPSIDKAYGEDFLDDGEHGGGRRLLKHLTDNDQVSRAIIVVRYYGNIHLGIKRFQVITDIAAEALQRLNAGETTLSKIELAKSSQPGPRKPHNNNHRASRTHRPLLAQSQPICHARPSASMGMYQHPLPLSQPLPNTNRFSTLAPTSTDDDGSVDGAEGGSSRYASLDDVRSIEDWSQNQEEDWNI